jgi:two-component system CheB/CheR fusion protein
MYGWNETEALAMNVRDRIPEDRRGEELEIVQRLGSSSVLEPYRTQRITRDGRVVEVLLMATALVDESGSVYAIATTERVMRSDLPGWEPDRAWKGRYREPKRT